MNTLYDALVNLSPVHDAELLEGYQRYASLLATVLTAQQLETYATLIQQGGQIRIFEEMTPAEFATLTPEEQSIATTVNANQDIGMENRRVVALLNQRNQHAIAPDLGTSDAS